MTLLKLKTCCLASLFLFGMSLVFSSSAADAANKHNSACLDVTKVVQRISVLPYMAHFEDAQGQVNQPEVNDHNEFSVFLAPFSFEQISNPAEEHVLGEGGIDHWVRFCLINPSKLTRELVLAASPAVIAEFDFYPQKRGVKSFRTGSDKPMSSRDIYGPEYDFNIVLGPGETQEFYLRIKARTGAYLLASVWDKASYLVAKDKREGVDGVLAGILVGLILYTMLLYVSVRQSSSLLYILWSSSTLVLLASIDGRVLEYLLPNAPSLSLLILVIFYPLTVMLSGLFARDFIRLKDYPRLNSISLSILMIYALALLATYSLGYSTYFKTNAAFAFIVVVYFGLICPFYALFVKKSVLAKYLLIAQLPLMLCILDRSLFSIGLTSEHYIPYTAKVGLVVEMILLAYCIGVTIYSEKNEAQRLALEQLERSNLLQSRYNTELEAEILKNTAEIREMNSGLERQAKQLLELDELKSKFFANISHEFRTPLTLIQGPLTQLLDQENHPDKAVISNAIRHSKDLQNLIDQLLTLSKFDGQSLTLQAQKTNISAVIERLVEQFSSLSKSKDIRLEFQSTAPEIEAYIDFDKLQIIINNLLNNAFKFTSSGGLVSIDVSTTALSDAQEGERATDEYVQITVSDTGQGIPSDELDFVFDRFFQSRSSTLAATGIGTGIGLALVKELTSMHAGDISVESVHEADLENTERSTSVSGTVFTLRLPLGSAHLDINEIVDSANMHLSNDKENENRESELLVQSDDNEVSKAFSSTTAQELPNTDKEFTILVVDDNDDMRSYIRSLLEPTYQIFEATDGLHAEQMVVDHSPNLIVTDLMMPKRDGLEFVKSLKENGEFTKIPVVMLTAKAGLDDRLKGLIAAVDDYIAKPFDARELKARIANLLVKHSQLQAFYNNESPSSAPEQQSDNEKQDSSLTYEEGEFMFKLRAVVNQYLGDTTFGVNQLADKMHMSKATLHRKLSLEGSFTPSEFIRHCRLEKARQLSLEGDVSSLTELANRVGFSQATYFARLYHKTFNALPEIKES